MPQISKGGKFIFGRSIIQPDGGIRLPPQAVREYGIAAEEKVYLFTGSKSTGGFCVTRRSLLEPSRLGHILRDMPQLLAYTAPAGTFFPYKGRSYCWLPVSPCGDLRLPEETLRYLALVPGMSLLSIRSSDIAFTMGAKGPLLERADAYEGDIPIYAGPEPLCG
ncbi:MAG: hypothetical protein K2O45_11790 [Oscillospiraceae bacterium]|nr:hypothetical protein [Oscillospiraceae bacterium]